MRIASITFCIVLTAAPALAQIDQVTTPPPNLVLSNYETVPVGPFGGLEGSAYAARVSDPSAAWFNPAGLSRVTEAQISGSAGVYQRTTVDPQALPNRGGSFQQLPNFVGFTFSPKERITVGAAMLTRNAWTQETDAELITGTAPTQQRFAYSADSDFTQRILAFAAGTQINEGLRVGGGLAFSIMDLRLVQSGSERVAESTGLRSLQVSARASGSAIQLRSQFGAQYDVSRWRLGAAVRTPGLTFYDSAGVTLDGVYDGGPDSLGASLFDPDANLDYRLPWEFQTGAAWVSDRVELEVDLQAYTSIDAHALISSDAPVVLYGDSGADVPPTVMTRPFAGLTSATKAVANVAAGGQFKLFKNRDMRLHAGIGTNQSPVADGDTVFSEVDLVSWTLGLSGSFGRVRFSAGYNHQSGRDEDTKLRNLISGEIVQSDIDVRMSGFIYSIAFQF